MIPNRMSCGRVPPAARTAVDAKLMERTGIDEFSLRRVRKEFILRFNRMVYTERRSLCEGGTCPRFTMIVAVLRTLWSAERWMAWLNYLEHSERDIEEMCRGEYPISPYLIRVFSALLGIKVDFLFLGSAPAVDKVGANIDAWPLTGTR